MMQKFAIKPLLFFCIIAFSSSLFSLDNCTDEIRGIVLVGSKDLLLSEEELEQVEGICLKGIDLPGSFSQFQQQLSPTYNHCKWDQATAQAIKEKVYQYYITEGRPFVIISIPDQYKETQVIQLIVEESRLGKLEVTGNKWVSSKKLLDYFHIKQGDPIYLRRVERDLDFVNRNPFRNADLIYSPGDENNTTDLTVKVKDRRPVRFYAGTDNTGVPTTGRLRIFAGFSWDQIFHLDHTFFYQYTTNTHVNRFHSNTFQYMALLPWKNILNIYGGFSILRADLPSPNRNNKGRNIQGSFRYLIPFAPSRSFSQEISFGFDLKNTNNTMAFTDLGATIGQTVNMSQFMIGYQYKQHRPAYSLQAGAEVYFSPMEWLPNQSAAAFNSLRPGAQNRWIYATGFFNYQQPFSHNFSYQLYLRGQATPQTLLPSEQLGLGGYSTVRGYDERQYNTDIGLYVSQELNFPSFSLFRSKATHKKNRMHFLLFLDAGGGCDNTKVPEIKWSNYLIGAGPGVRYSFESYVVARLDWGIKLHHQKNFTGGNSMFHFSATGSF